MEPLEYEQGVNKDPEPVGGVPAPDSQPLGPRSEEYLCIWPILGETAGLLLRPILSDDQLRARARGSRLALCRALSRPGYRCSCVATSTS